MTEYRLTAGQRVPDSEGEDRTDLFSFRVTDHTGADAYSAHATRSLAAYGSLAEVNWRDVLSILAIDQIERGLLAGALTPVPGLHRWVVDDEATVLRVANAPKQCELRRPAATRGLVCLATESGNPEPTTLPLCATCEMPDARLVCSGLVHPATEYDEGGVLAYVSTPDDAGPSLSTSPSRRLKTAFCEVDLDARDWAGCLPWTKDCWYRVVDTSENAPAADSGAPRRIIDEMGYLRLVYAERFRVGAKEFWPTSEPSAYAALLDLCSSRKHFERHLVILDDVVNGMKPHGQLTEERRKNGGRINGVTALGRVLEDRIDGADASYVAPLRALKTIRNSFSHEPSPELLTALRTLGVEPYPPRDWEMAWWQIAASVAQALEATRLALQTTTLEDSGGDARSVDSE